MHECDLRQRMKCAEAVRGGAADRRECTVRRNQPLLNFSITSGALKLCGVNTFELPVLFSQHCKHIDQHRMYDEAVVIIEVKKLSIAISAIALIPAKHPAHASFQPILDGVLTHNMQRCLSHCGKHYPIVVLRRCNLS